MILPNDRKHVNAGRAARPKHFDDLAFRIDVPRLPRLEPNDHLVAGSGCWSRRALAAVLRGLFSHRPEGGPAPRRLNINVVHDPRIVRHDVEEILRLLERTDDRVVCALENANDAAFRAIAAFSPCETFITRDPRHHLVTMHRCPRVLRGDEEILFASLFAREKS